MCWANKCCFYFPLDVGCILIGFVNYLFGASTTVGATALLVLDKNYQWYHGDKRHYLQTVFEFDMNRKIIDITVISAIVVGVLSMIFASFLIMGIKKNIPSLVLSYFIGGIVLTIVCFLSALLELVNMFWMLAGIKVIMCLINIHFLVVVHTSYEMMSRGKVFVGGQDSDQQPFMETYPDLNGE